MAGQPKNEDNPSGLKLEDVVQCVQAKMHEELVRGTLDDLFSLAKNDAPDLENVFLDIIAESDNEQDRLSTFQRGDH